MNGRLTLRCQQPKTRSRTVCSRHFTTCCPGDLFSVFGLPLAYARWRSGLRKIPLRSKRLEELPVYLLLGAITLATLLRPRGAERVEYEGIPYSQRAGIHNDLVSIGNLCVERHTPRLVVKGTAAVLTRGLGTVTVAVKPRGWSFVRHKVNLETTEAAT